MWQLLELDLASVFNFFETEEIHFSLSREMTLRMSSAALWQDASRSRCAVGSRSWGTALLEQCHGAAMAPLLTHPNPKGALDFSMLLGQRVQVYVFSCSAAFLEDAQGFFCFFTGGPGDWCRQQHCTSGTEPGAWPAVGVTLGGFIFGWLISFFLSSFLC